MSKTDPIIQLKYERRNHNLSMTDIISQLFTTSLSSWWLNMEIDVTISFCFSAKYRTLLWHSTTRKGHFVQCVLFYKPSLYESSLGFQTCTSQCISSCPVHIHYYKMVPKHYFKKWCIIVWARKSPLTVS